MRTTVTLGDEMMRELLAATGTDNKTQAVQMAVSEFLRRQRLEKLRALRGKIDIVSNEELEEAELAEIRELHG